jgi:DNA-binding NarL/FixJ family response regulator
VDAGSSEVHVVAIVDDCDLVADGVRAGLAAIDPRWGVITQERHEITLEGTPADLVLWDPGLERGRVEGTAQLVRRVAPTPVIGFSWRYELPLVMESLRQGCAGYLLKSLRRRVLADQLADALDHSSVVDARISGELLTAAARLRDDRWWPGEHLGLSRRESDILALLAEGLDTTEISEALFLGRETVRTHLRTLYGKLGVGTRAQAVARAYDEGLVFVRAPQRT